ncbi:heme ABC transporter ATP-binding protein [Moritella viscosa]|uniref:Hemin transport system ATP-binding protein HmuV n=1 Tax=Moritella viscosa TaxID=80854 RepID=A0ABY1HBS6_9GAMM|nr:heme ABC transporter ATP-binding protein [Moritella viscosa]SGY90517.1 Hemin transport system ATP-binding protein HmuV [Moritella viscosa]SGY99816.1 Hemin transport system ATP-binding protein HmuV [Moritella viscosa]SHO26045.1 Hemin transport system ATP-binding protein HmuV [Moritella viscosa]
MLNVTKSVLHCQQLNYNIAGKCIFNDLNLTLDEGEFLAVLGPNGAGKSSLFKAITGELKPTSGTIFLNGEVRNNINRSEVAKMLAVLPQSASLSFSFQVIDVVLMGGLQADSGQAKVQELADTILREQDIEHLRTRAYPTLSGGEKQRVHFARVLLQLAVGNKNKPQLLLLDEPTAALDINYQHQLLKSAKHLAQTGVAVVAVLHDLNLAAKYADRIILLKEGNICANGSAEQVVTTDNIRDVYGYESTVINNAEFSHPIVM